MKFLSVLVMLAGISLGYWQWQVNNINLQEANKAAAVGDHPNVYALVYTPVPIEDRAMGMAFAYLICTVGGFMFVGSNKVVREAS